MTELNGKSENSVEVLDLEDWEVVHGGPFPLVGKIAKGETMRKNCSAAAHGLTLATRMPDLAPPGVRS